MTQSKGGDGIRVPRTLRALLGMLLYGVFLATVTSFFGFNTNPNAGDAPSYLEFDFSGIDAAVSGHRTIPYPLFLHFLETLGLSLWFAIWAQVFLLGTSLGLLFWVLARMEGWIAPLPLLAIPLHPAFFGEIINVITEPLALALFTLAVSLLFESLHNSEFRWFWAATGGFLMFASLFTRPAFLGPALVVTGLFVLFALRKPGSGRKNSGLAWVVIISLVVPFLALTAVRVAVTEKTTFMGMTGGLLAPHISMLYPTNGDGERAEAENWIHQARGYLNKPCDTFYHEPGLYISQSEYETHHACYTEILIGAWTIAIYEETGRLPLPESYSFANQIKSSPFVWPNDEHRSLSRYHLAYGDGVETSFLDYAVNEILAHPLPYLRWVFFGSLHSTLGFVLELGPTLLASFIWGIASGYLRGRGWAYPKKAAGDPSAALKLLATLPIPLWAAILATTIPINVGHMRVFVVWLPLLAASSAASGYLVGSRTRKAVVGKD